MAVTVVVMGRNYTSRLGMIRAAGMIGCEVHVIKTQNRTNVKDKIDSYSKYVKSFYTIDESNEKALIKLLHQKFSYSGEKTVLLPTDDPTASIIDRHQEELKEHFLFPHINHKPGAVIRFMDKGLQKELAKAAGLPVAQGWTVDFDGQRYVVPAGVVFPCFVKPQVSLKGAKKFMKKCNTREELEAYLREIATAQTGKNEYCSLLLEQFINIEKEYDVPGFAYNQKVIIPAFIEKGLVHKGVTGTGTLRNSNEFSKTKTLLQELIKKLHFIGLIDVEFYESKGRVYFNELNMRFGASGFAMTGSGINLPAMLINTLIEGKHSDKKETITLKNRTFASEKVCFQEYTSNVISWEQLWKLIDGADFNFIRVEDDPKPFKEFKRQANIKRLKKQILRLMGKDKK